MVGLAPADGLFRPVHELSGARGDCVYFLVLPASAALVVDLTCEDDVGVVRFGELVLVGADCRPGRRLPAGPPAAGELEAAGREAEAAPSLRPW